METMMLSWKFLRPITLVRAPMFLVSACYAKMSLFISKSNYVPFLKKNKKHSIDSKWVHYKNFNLHQEGNKQAIINTSLRTLPLFQTCQNCTFLFPQLYEFNFVVNSSNLIKLC